MSLVSELKRRKVLRVAAAYLVVGWLLTEVLTTILPTLGAPAWVPNAVILVFALGFIPAVFLSWVYQITPGGIKKDRGVDGDGREGAESAGTKDYFAIASVVLIIVIVAVFSASDAPDEAASDAAEISFNSVAVLPFVNMSNDEDNEYFSDGLTETLLHMLVQIPDLKVAARTSSFAFKGKNMDIREIAEALQVAHVLEGSVQQSGNRVRITAQLIRADDGFHVFSEIYDRTNDDIFDIQDEIAAKVGGALSASLLDGKGGDELFGVDTTDPDAYDLYLQALKERATFSYGGLRTSEELLKGALTIDPDFLDAKTELASNYLQQFETGLMDGTSAFTVALAIADQVLAVRPNDVSARAIRLFAEIAPHTREASPGALQSAARELESLVKEHPGEYQARILLTRMLQGLQQSDKALQLQLDALERDPYNARIHYEIGSLYLELDQIEEGRAALQKSLDIEPRQPNAYLQLAFAALSSGDGVEYLRQLLKALETDPRDHEIPGFIASFLYQLGLTEEGEYFRNRVAAIAPTSEIAYRVEMLRAVSAGNEEASVAAARRAIEDDIGDRQFAYGGAVQHLLRIAARRGTVEEETEYLEQYAPGIFDIDSTSTATKYRTAQFVALDAWVTSLSHDELLLRLEKLRAIAAAFGVDILDDPKSRVAVLAMQGDVEQAVDVAIADVFTQPVSMNLTWKEDYAQAQYTDFSADARVQEAMKKWEDDQSALRERVRVFLADLSAA